MRFVCPECGSRSCVQAAERVIAAAPTLYVKCPSCNDLILEKAEEINLTSIRFDSLRCENCRKRPLDVVMAHILASSVQNKKRPGLTLRQVGTPLLSPSVPIYARPQIGYKRLLLLTDQPVIAAASERILRDVQEVKGVIYGNAAEPFGLAYKDATPRTCRTLAGCDMRADLVTSAYGQLLIYKSQSKIHVEHDHSIKMAKLSMLPIADRVVFDALAGPGTLGLTCALMGAKKVILNDAWLPAVENAYLNLQVNRYILGIQSISRAPRAAKASDSSSYLFATAKTHRGFINLYHGAFEEFNIKGSGTHVILVDPFPSTEAHFEALIENIHRKYPRVHIICV
jgi:predicted Zn finger-like uncharacterized protein